MEKQKIWKERLAFPSYVGEVPMEAVAWHPPGAPRAMLVLVHGMQEHVERYEHLAAALTRAGFLVCGYNQLGHGGSLLDGRGGILPDGARAGHLAADCRRFLRGMRREHPGLPCFLMGHSFGSFVVRAALTDRHLASSLNGVILSGTAGESVGLRCFALPATRLLAGIFGPECQSAAYDRLANFTFARHFPGETSPHRWVSSLAAEVEAFDTDPKMGFVLSLGAYRAVLETLALVSGPRWAGQVESSLPVLLLSGACDPVGENGRGVRQVAAWLLEAGTRDLTLHLEPGARHELLREPCCERILLLIQRWMGERLPDTDPNVRRT